MYRRISMDDDVRKTILQLDQTGVLSLAPSNKGSITSLFIIIHSTAPERVSTCLFAWSTNRTGVVGEANQASELYGIMTMTLSSQGPSFAWYRYAVR